MMIGGRAVAWSIPLVFLTTSCGDSDETISTGPVAIEDGGAMVVTWTGSECAYESPGEAATGGVQIDFTNEGDGPANLYLIEVDEGTTAQTLTEEFGEGGLRTEVVSDASFFESSDPIDPGGWVQWSQTLDDGEYLVVCDPVEMWLAGDFEVITG